MRRTVFLDRDGVLNEKSPEDDYVKSIGEFRLMQGVKEAVEALSGAECRLVVVTNQRGIARGRMTAADVEAIHQHMLNLLPPASIHAVYYCPHQASECDCRKPAVGLFQRAKEDCPDIDFRSSVVVGDSLSDLRAAAALSCPAILIAAGRRRSAILSAAASYGLPVAGVEASLLAAVPLILQAGVAD